MSADASVDASAEIVMIPLAAAEQTRSALEAGENADVVAQERADALTAQHAQLAAGLPADADGQR